MYPYQVEFTTDYININDAVSNDTVTRFHYGLKNNRVGAVIKYNNNNLVLSDTQCTDVERFRNRLVDSFYQCEILSIGIMNHALNGDHWVISLNDQVITRCFFRPVKGSIVLINQTHNWHYYVVAELECFVIDTLNNIDNNNNLQKALAQLGACFIPFLK
jgi:hypothetical protein